MNKAEEGYEYKVYGNSTVYILEGEYTREELQDMIDAMDRLSAALKNSMTHG